VRDHFLKITDEYNKPWCLNKDGRIGGFSLWLHSEDEIHLTNLILIDEFKNIGIGSVIMQKLCDILKELKYQWLTLQVDRDNYHAQHIYTKQGFIKESDCLEYKGLGSKHSYLYTRKPLFLIKPL